MLVILTGGILSFLALVLYYLFSTEFKKYIDKLSDLQFGPKSKIVFLVTNNSFVTNNSDGIEEKPHPILGVHMLWMALNS